MNPEFQRCLENNKIKKFSPGRKLAVKELDIASSDLAQAKISFQENKNYKWATIQCYYAMFHAARALLYIKNYREKSHHCLMIAIKAFYIETKQLPYNLLDGFQKAKTLRENADYYDEWSEIGVETIMKFAEEFIDKTRHILNRELNKGNFN